MGSSAGTIEAYSNICAWMNFGSSPNLGNSVAGLKPAFEIIGDMAMARYRKKEMCDVCDKRNGPTAHSLGERTSAMPIQERRAVQKHVSFYASEISSIPGLGLKCIREHNYRLALYKQGPADREKSIPGMVKDFRTESLAESKKWPNTKEIRAQDLYTRTPSTKSQRDDAHKVLIESLNLLRDVLADVAGKGEWGHHQKKSMLIKLQRTKVVLGIGADLANGVSGASMYLGAGIEYRPPSCYRHQFCGCGSWHGVVRIGRGIINTSSLFTGVSTGAISTAVLALSQGLGGGAATGLGLKAANTTSFNDTGSMKLFSSLGGNLVSNAASNSTFLNNAGLSGIAGNIGQGLSTSFLGGVDLKTQLAQIMANMTLSPAMVNQAALSLSQGLGGGASSALGLSTGSTPQFATDGINGVAGNVGQGLSSSFLHNVSTAKIVSQFGGGGVAFSGSQLNQAALSLAQGLGSGAASALKLVSTPATNASFNTDGIDGIIGNVEQGLSTSFLQNFSVAQAFGSVGTALNLQTLVAVASELGAGLGQGVVIGLGIQPEPAADAVDPSMANSTGSPLSAIKPISQSFGRGLSQSILANGTLTKSMSLFAGNGTTNSNVGKIAEGFAIGLVDGAQTSLQMVGGLRSLLGMSSNQTDTMVTMSPASTFDDSVGGAATGFGSGLGSEVVKGVLQAFGKSSMAGSATVAPAAMDPAMAPVTMDPSTNTSLVVRKPQKRSIHSVALIQQKATMDPTTMGTQMSLANVVDPFLQKGIDAIGCQGIGELVAIVLSVVPTSTLLSAAKSGDSLKNLTASFGSITNQTYMFEENSNTFVINIQNQDIRINGSGVVKFAALTILHVIFAVIGFAIAVPTIMILNSSRHFAVMTGRYQLFSNSQKWQMLLGAFVVVPSSILTFGFGTGGEGNRSHFSSSSGHGVLGLLLFLLTFAVAFLWQFRATSNALYIGAVASIGVFFILIVLTRWVDDTEEGSGKRPDSEVRPMVISKSMKIEHTAVENDKGRAWMESSAMRRAGKAMVDPEPEERILESNAMRNASNITNGFQIEDFDSPSSGFGGFQLQSRDTNVQGLKAELSEKNQYKEKKKKCNEVRPQCNRCSERDLQCEYEPVKPRKRRRTSFAGSARSNECKSPLSSKFYDQKWPARYDDNYEIRNNNGGLHKWEVASEYSYPESDSYEWELPFDEEDGVEEIIRTHPPTNNAASGSIVRSRSQYPDLAMIAPSPVVSPLLEFSAPVYMEFSEKRNRRALVDHFCNVLSHLIVFKEDTGNPFRQLVLPLSHACSPVMNAIFALSSAHLEYGGIENEEKSLTFHNQALQGLAQLIDQNDEANREEILGAIMLLVYYEVLVQRGSSNIVNGHLKGAMTIMKSGPRICTPTSMFLERAFRFYDVIAALSMGTSPNTTTQPITTPFPFTGSYHTKPINSPLNSVDTLLGLSIDLWPVIHRLSHLLSFKTSLEAALAAGETTKATVLKTELESTSQAIEHALENWKPATISKDTPPVDEEDPSAKELIDEVSTDTRMQSILSNAEAYRHSAFVYLYRTIRSHPRTHTLVQKHTHLSLVACVNVVGNAEKCLDGPMSALLWPLFVAACEAITPEDRDFVRTRLRNLLKELQFIDDKIAFFNIPALEIDTEVNNLIVLRGITFSLSSLSFVVHGVEVGIKLSNDMELAIQTEEVTVKLFRKTEIGDCFVNLKGGQYEMTFGKVTSGSHDADGDAVFIEDTPLLKAASTSGDSRRPDTLPEEIRSLKQRKAQFTDGSSPQDSSAKASFNLIENLSPDNEEASGCYKETVGFITNTNTIYEARQHVKKLNNQAAKTDDNSFDQDDLNGTRAAMCSWIHGKPSVSHPPRRSIKVATLQNLAPPYIQRFLHRLPMLLRLLLNPLSPFHPVHAASIIATASGQWIEYVLVEKVFKDYAESYSKIRTLKKRVSHWLSDANFAVELAGINGTAQVPFIPTYEIICQLAFDNVPSFLLPVPSKDKKQKLEEKVDTADGKPKKLQAQHKLEQGKKNETNVKITVHARLPACFDQELLDFIAALVKATKVVEFEAQHSAMDDEVHSIKDFERALKGGMKEGLKKAVVDGVINDRWIAKMVGKITKKLEVAQGEAGYSGEIPVPLEVYRTGEVEREGEKLLP
ncbi:hypothetical protein G7Y89_g10611 [Cudoniella acicularis]|uniref:Zn(2)-C6 fungal-type domain-containing protein n=1 Tax=Cudoniella acicularis TaxID=354080 RepID=A0A8H4RCE3_9HELO|nr:hypothetical protein G7Y89_g10611 [Cudoniella acicularis]